MSSKETAHVVRSYANAYSLSFKQVANLIDWKKIYSGGFTPMEGERLKFHRWLHRQRKLANRVVAAQVTWKVPSVAEAIQENNPDITDGARSTLTQEDIRRLTLYKWKYALESAGFNPRQVQDMSFLKYIYATVRGTS